MQIDIGGVGLNLQAASVVILMEPQLKPSTESRRSLARTGWARLARSWSTGSSPQNSIDEHVVQLSGFKADLFEQLARRSTLAEAATELPPATGMSRGRTARMGT